MGVGPVRPEALQWGVRGSSFPCPALCSQEGKCPTLRLPRLAQRAGWWVGGTLCQLSRLTALLVGTSPRRPVPHVGGLEPASRAPGLGRPLGPWAPGPLPPALTAPTPQDPLSSLERELALQLQIAEAARRLSREENLGRQARRQRKHAVLQEERKLQELERCLGARRRHSGPVPLGPGECARPRLPGAMWEAGRHCFWSACCVARLCLRFQTLC